jgi:signal peptidase I
MSRTDMTAAESPKSLLRDYFETIATCVIFVLFARTFVFQQSKIPTGSMIPTLLIGDYIMVNKFIYSPALDAPLLGALEREVMPTREVERGDVVVFKFPEEPEKDYIKRVIALPGDTIEIRERQVYVNGEPLDEPYKVHRNPRGLNIDQDDYPRTTVPHDALFCMGDNRDNSRDSRAWGFVPRSYLKGRAFMIWWSYDEERDAYQKTALIDRLRGIWSKITHLFTKSRWSRTFNIIR